MSEVDHQFIRRGLRVQTIVAMILAAALSVLYASTQDGSGSDVIDQQREGIVAEG